MRDHISLEEAKSKIYFYRDETAVEVVRVEASLGRTLAECSCAMLDQPPFRRSAMDGYALNSFDVEIGRTYPVVDEVDAGDTREVHLNRGEAIRIMTGACVPEGADVVIPQEMSDCGENEVTFHALPRRNNICPVGEDFKNEEIILDRDTIMDPLAISCAAAGGVSEVHVYKRTKVAVISTGSELKRVGSTLKHGQIFDSNQPYLVSKVKQFGCDVTMATYIEDDLEEIKDEIKRAVKLSDFIITTGGVSVGKKDLLEQAITEIGGDIVFHGIDIKPGMPTMFSVFDDKPILSLSGNPFAASCLFDLLNPFKSPVIITAQIADTEMHERSVRRMVRGYYDGAMVHLSENHKNGVTKSGVGSNCLVELAVGDEPIYAGDIVKVYLL